MIASATVSISPYRMVMKLDGFKKLMVYLPSAVSPLEVSFSVHRPYEGFVSKGEFYLLALIDRSPWETAADYGSKVWLMSEVFLMISVYTYVLQANLYLNLVHIRVHIC